jgi:hypothetical protein
LVIGRSGLIDDADARLGRLPALGPDGTIRSSPDTSCAIGAAERGVPVGVDLPVLLDNSL